MLERVGESSSFDKLVHPLKVFGSIPLTFGIIALFNEVHPSKALVPILDTLVKSIFYSAVQFANIAPSIVLIPLFITTADNLWHPSNNPYPSVNTFDPRTTLVGCFVHLYPEVIKPASTKCPLVRLEVATV